MSQYTDEDVRAAQEAIGAFFGPDGNFDYYAAREAVAAVAPAIAARALREAARDRRELLLCAPDADALDRRADEIANGRI